MRKMWFILAAILMSIAIALPVVSCAPKAPAAEKSVTYLSLSDLTGPGAGLVFPIVEATGFAFDDINSKGGIKGVKINKVVVDTRYDTARTVSAYKRYRTEPKAFWVFIPLTPGVKALAAQMEADKLPCTTPADGEFQAKPGWVFLAGVPYQDGFAAALDWMLKDWKAKGKSGAPTIGYMSWDSQYGREALRGGNEYAAQLGVKLLKPEFFPTGAADHTVWLSRINDSGADYCFMGGVDPTQSLILRDAFKLGLTKKIQFVSDFWGLDENVGIKLHPEATEGAVLVSPFIRGDESRKLPQVVDLWGKYGKGPIADMKCLFPSGILLAKYLSLAIEKGIDEVGYDKFDGEAAYKASQTLTGTSSDGVSGPCAYSPTDRKATAMVRFYRVQSGKTNPITDWVPAPNAVSLHKGW
jgi:branched-chain amino acid transport system substrate-binding protein